MPVAEAILDIESLLTELSPDSPCGEDLEYDPSFGEMERASEGKPEQQFGDTIVEAEEPEWRDVKKHALALFERTRDLRASTYLCQSLLATDGIPAFAEGLQLLSGLIIQHWDSVHPQLDPDDDNDPTIRVNSLASLCSADTTLRLLKSAPIVESRMVGRFSLRDIEAANNGESNSDSDEDSEESSGESKPDMAVISAAFQDVELDELQAFASAVNSSIECVTSIESTVTEQVGAGNALSFASLVSTLKSIQAIYDDQLARRGVSTESTGEAVDESGEVVETATSADGTAVVAVPKGLSGEITSREDVIKAIDKSLDYFRRYEPSSPLPLLLKRAKRLANLNFMEILQDLAPDGLSQVQAISGTDSSHDEDESSEED